MNDIRVIHGNDIGKALFIIKKIVMQLLIINKAVLRESEAFGTHVDGFQ